MRFSGILVIFVAVSCSIRIGNKCNDRKLYCDLDTYLDDTIKVEGEFSTCAGISRFRTFYINNCKSDCRMSLDFSELSNGVDIESDLKESKDCEEYFSLKMIGIFTKEELADHFEANNSRLIVLEIIELKGPKKYKLKRGRPPEAN